MVAPSDVFSVGLALANKIMEKATIFQPDASIVFALFALVLMVCFAIIAALLVVAPVESYYVIARIPSDTGFPVPSPHGKLANLTRSKYSAKTIGSAALGADSKAFWGRRTVNIAQA